MNDRLILKNRIKEARTEKNLSTAEDSRNEVSIYFSSCKFAYHAVPELVFHENGEFRIYYFDEFPCIALAVERKVAHDVGLVVVFAHLVAAWTEECKHNLLAFALVAFNQRTTLFEFAERSRVKPNIFLFRFDFCTQIFLPFLASRHHKFCLAVERGSQPYRQKISANAKEIEEFHR